MSRIEVSKRLVIINSASSAVTLILNITVLIWLQQYLLKRISPEEYSLIPIMLSLMAFSPLLTTFLTTGLGRYITVAYARDDQEEVTRICSTMFPVLLVAGLVLLAIGWLAAWKIDLLVDIDAALVPEAQLMLGLLVLSAAARLPLAVFESGFLVRQKLMLHDIIDIGCQFLRILLLLVLILGVGAKALWVTVASVVSEFVYLVVSTIISIRLVPSQRVRWGVFHRSLAGEITSFGGWNFVSQIAETIKQAMDPLVLNRFAAAVDVAVFYVAGIAPRQLRLMALPLTRPFFPVIAAVHADGDTERLGNIYLRTARYQTWALLFVGVPAAVFSYEVMHLYLGGKYDQAGPVMLVLLIVAMLGGLNALGPAVVAVVGRIKGYALRLLAAYLANFVLALLFVAYLREGAMGSAVATLIAVAVGEVMVIGAYCRRLVGTTTRAWLAEVVAPTMLPAIPALLLCLIAKWLDYRHSWAEVLTASALSGALYILLVLRFWLMAEDKRDLGRLADRLPKSLGNLLYRLAKVPKSGM